MSEKPGHGDKLTAEGKRTLRKDVLGDVCCIMGNVPISLIATGTPEQVKAYCKDLIDYCGKGGGHIITTGTQIDDGPEEIIRAMVDFTKAYGVYERK